MKDKKKYIRSTKELEAAVKVSTLLFEELYQESKNAAYSTMMGLYASLIEQCSALVILFKNKTFMSTQAISRTILDNA